MACGMNSARNGAGGHRSRHFRTEHAQDPGARFAAVPPRYRATYFRHTGPMHYSAGYYAYLWARCSAPMPASGSWRTAASRAPTATCSAARSCRAATWATTPSCTGTSAARIRRSKLDVKRGGDRRAKQEMNRFLEPTALEAGQPAATTLSGRVSMTTDPFISSASSRRAGKRLPGGAGRTAGGRKRTHWMWFVFPQCLGLGASATSRRFAIRSLEEARAYLDHPVPGAPAGMRGRAPGHHLPRACPTSVTPTT